MSNSSRQCEDTRPMQIPTGLPPPSIILEINSVSPPALSCCCIGPLTIESQINEITFRLQLPAQYRIHPTFYVSLFKPVSPSVTEPDKPALPSLPEIIEEPLVYRVQYIVDSWRPSSTIQDGRLKYLIDGKDMGRRKGPGWNGIMGPPLLAEFHLNHPDCPAPRGCGLGIQYSRFYVLYKALFMQL